MRSLVVGTGCATVVLLFLPALEAQNSQDVPRRIAAIEQQVQTYLQQQKPELAIPLLRQIVSLDPKNVNAQGNLGVLLYFQNAYVESIPNLRAALKLQPGLWRIQALLGIAEKRTGDPAAAEKDLDRSFPRLDDKKFQLQAGLELIELQSASGQLGKALTVAARLEEVAPDNPQIEFVKYHISRKMMDQSLLNMMMAAPDSAEMHMMMAGELGRQGDQANAIAQYRQAIRLNPALPGVHFELAEQLRTSTDPELNAQAEAEYQAALQANQYDELSRRALGALMASKGDYKTAEEHYRKALALQPNDSEAKTGLAIVLNSTNRTADAIALLESAVKDDPSNISAHYRLSLLYRRAGRTADAAREMDAYNRYKDVREQLDKVFRQLGGAVRENPGPGR